ncbi:MAG TPA: ParB/RepB/Spo0J family partition protein [Deltaproteobacteria bacterium]|nr:ParB/RepB/Spo0J family partition protein [Deltaproteobacteria bacterium]
MKTKPRLGRGIDALFGDSLAEDSAQIIDISLADVYPNPIQPRKFIDEEKIAELSESIKHNGLISPIIVRKINSKYEIIAGERRYHACKRAGIKKIPSIVKEISDEEAFKISLIENLQREDLNPMEEAEAYHTLKKQFNLTHQEIADAVAKDRSTVTNALRLVNLPEEIKSALRDGTITTGHARAILMVESILEKRALLEKIIHQGLSVRDTEQFASNTKKRKSPQKRTDQHLESLSSLLSERFSTKVVCTWGKRKGKIIIDVSSKEDLRRIVEELSRYETPI